MDRRSGKHTVESGGSSRYRSAPRGYNATQRRRRKIRTFYIIAVIVIAVAAAAVLASLTLKISEVVVTGSSVYSQEDIRSYCPAKAGDGLLTTDTGAVETALLEKLPYIGAIMAEKRFPSKLLLHIEPAQEFCMIHQGSYSVLISDQFKVLQVKEYEAGDLLQVEGITLFSPEPGKAMQFKNDEMERVFHLVMENLEKTEFPTEKITVLDFSDLSRITFLYDNRLEVVLGDSENMEYKLAFAARTLENTDGTGLAENAEGTLDFSRVSDTDQAVFSPKETEPASSAPKNSSSSQDESSGDEVSSGEPDNTEDGTEENTDDNADGGEDDTGDGGEDYTGDGGDDTGDGGEDYTGDDGDYTGDGEDYTGDGEDYTGGEDETYDPEYYGDTGEDGE